MSTVTKAQLSEAVAAEYELVWQGSDTITINGFGSVTFSAIKLATAAQIAKYVDGDGNGIYVKKKAPKASSKQPTEAKS